MKNGWKNKPKIVKINSQLYKVNPRHIFQGSSVSRNSELKTIIELYCKDC